MAFFWIRCIAMRALGMAIRSWVAAFLFNEDVASLYLSTLSSCPVFGVVYFVDLTLL